MRCDAVFFQVRLAGRGDVEGEAVGGEVLDELGSGFRAAAFALGRLAGCCWGLLR